MTERIDFQAIASAALAMGESLAASWLPDGKRQGHEWIARNPTRDDAKPGSFSVNLNSGAWADFATNDKGGDFISLMAYLEGLPQAKAACKLREIVLPFSISEGTAGTQGTALNNKGFSGSRTVPASGNQGNREREPIPRHAQDKRPSAHRTHGKPTSEWCYRSANGEPLFWVCRFDPTDGRKQFAPQTWNHERGAWEWKAPPAPRPLYGLEKLSQRPGALVIVTEGEKAADAAQTLFPDDVTVSSMNGSQSPGKSDWTPLAVRKVIIWPDDDEPGSAYADQVRKLAKAAGAASVDILRLPFPHPETDATGAARLAHSHSNDREVRAKGWDAADALADGFTPAHLELILSNPDAYLLNHAHAETEKRQAAEGTGEPSAASEPDWKKLPRPEVKRPCYSVHDEWTGYGKPGLYWHTVKDKVDEVELIDTWICSPLWTDAITSGEDDSDFGLLLRFRNALGRLGDWSMPMRMLRGSGEELRGELLDLGVRIDVSSYRLLNSYLMNARPARKVLAATSTGWHDDGKVFVMPNESIGNGDVRFQSEHARHDAFATAGTLDGWRYEIGSRCIGNPSLTFAVSAALAGPLLAPIQRSGCGFHILGDSSSGKTTLLHAAASCWGGGGFIRTWQATAAGLEGIAAAVNDTALVLDEISEADSRSIGSFVYQLGNGTGKSRGARTGGARAVQRWRIILLSSGERSLASTMAEGGKAPKAGMEIRLMDIPCARAFGVFDCVHDQPNARAFADALRASAARHYGHAGPELVKRMIEQPKDWGDIHQRILALPMFAAENSLEGRAAHAFALVALAGELATEWGITNWPEGEAIAAAAWSFKSWRDARPKEVGEHGQILRSVADFLSAHGDSRFSHVQDTGPSIIRDRAGWYRDTADNRHFLFTASGLRDAAAGFDFRRVLKALDLAGWIIDRDQGRNSKKTKVQGRALNLYAVAVPEGEED